MRELHQKVVILLLVLVPLGFTVYSIFFLWGGLANWLDLGLLMGMYLLVGLGVTIGYHRYMAISRPGKWQPSLPRSAMRMKRRGAVRPGFTLEVFPQTPT